MGTGVTSTRAATIASASTTALVRLSCILVDCLFNMRGDYCAACKDCKCEVLHPHVDMLYEAAHNLSDIQTLPTTQPCHRVIFSHLNCTGKDPHEVSPYFDFGNPFDAGMCARRVLKNFTHSVLHKEGLAHEGTFHPDGVANMDHHPAIGSIKRHRQRRALAANTEHDPKKKLHHEEAEEGEERVDKKGEEGDVGAANFGRVELATQTITTDQRSSYTSYISSSSNSFRGTGSSIELNSSSISQNARKLTLANNPVFRKGVRALVYIASDNPGAAKQMNQVSTNAAIVQY